MKQPKTWNELLDAGYVVELDECQVAEFRLKTGQLDRPKFKYLTPHGAMEASNDAEAKTRAKIKKEA